MVNRPIFVSFAGFCFLLSGCLSGCRSEPPSPAATSSVVNDACALLTPSEVSAELGAPVDPGKHVPATSAIMCFWDESGTSGDTANRVSVNFTSLDSFEREKRPVPRIVITPVSGVGTEAFDVATVFGHSIYVKQGDRAFVLGIKVKGVAPDQLKEKERALAVKVAARL